MMKSSIPNETKIFILEDSPVMAENLMNDLVEFGYIRENFILAVTLQEALDKSEASGCGFIISDLNLPDGLGTTFLKFARGNATLKNVPYMMLTTNDEVNFMIEAIKLGANEYCVKPWAKETLFEKMQYAWKDLHPEPTLASFKIQRDAKGGIQIKSPSPNVPSQPSIKTTLKEKAEGVDSIKTAPDKKTQPRIQAKVQSKTGSTKINIKKTKKSNTNNIIFVILILIIIGALGIKYLDLMK